MSVAVIGQGFVGGSLTTVLSERFENVFVFDKAGITVPGGISEITITNGEKVKPSSVSEFVSACEATKMFSGIFFVCVPTPMKKDGSADISIVESVISEIHSAPHNWEAPHRVVVLKSTVPPGTTDMFNKKYEKGWPGLTVVFNPEFLTEANALNDMRNQDRIILGGPRPHINKVKELFQQRFPNVKIIKTSAATAEVVKYMTNCYLAVKVSFANEFYQICEALDDKGHNVDYDKVVEYATNDKRLGTSHWAVPGPVPVEGKYIPGFGGSCFPKDINAIISLAKSLDIEPKVMIAAWEKNLEVRPLESRDWESMKGRAIADEE